MKSCPKCKQKNLVKNGFNQGRQRYKYKDCGRDSSVRNVGVPTIKKKISFANVPGRSWNESNLKNIENWNSNPLLDG